MGRAPILCFLALAGALFLPGCGGRGSGEDYVTTRSEANLDRDALLLAARDVEGYVVPLQIVQSRQSELAAARAAFPEFATTHATATYNGHELHFAVSNDAPWLASWKSGTLTTGVREIDDILQQYNAKSVTFLNEDGDQSWFNVTFDTYLRANRAAGLFFGKSAALRVASTVSMPSSETDIRYERVDPNLTRMTFISGESVTVLEKTGSGRWTKKPL
jgi:hypothetical protein